MVISDFVDAWNAHRVPGIRGEDLNVLAAPAPQTTFLHAPAVPTTSEIIAVHCGNGGTVTAEHGFGSDPLEAYAEVQCLRECDFVHRYPSMGDVFESTLHGDGALFREALLYFISLTNAVSQLV